ncbi:MAG: OsmC family protein [Verrucomicrobiae bacterium]|nr:OsmC family protein [Verrucomicrobiae bacterium]
MPQKTVIVELQQANGFRTECCAGKHTIVIDQPAAAGGTDTGPTPLEYQLIALGGCIAAIGRIIANQRRLPVRGFRITVSGDINTDRLLGKPSDTRVGFSQIRVNVQIEAELSREEKEKLLHEIDQRCPISENLKLETPVSVSLAD